MCCYYCYNYLDCPGYVFGFMWNLDSYWVVCSFALLLFCTSTLQRLSCFITCYIHNIVIEIVAYLLHTIYCYTRVRFVIHNNEESV